ncbi:MAG: CoA-binding protein [Lachnospiraceae bacterium]|nr:CoA-binding protein [Lachnospiraceae bacterium]
MNFKELFNPKTIAVVGANESEGFGGAVCKNLVSEIDDDNRVFYVNPKRDTLFGKKCYHNLKDVDSDIDLLIIAVNKKLVTNILKEGKGKGAKAAVVFASGYSETGREEDILLEKDMLKTAEELDITILGPNCAGFDNFIDGIKAFAFLSEERDRKGNIGIITQSGMIGLSLIDNQYTKFSYNISCGNANGLKMTDLITYLADDKNTKVIGLYIDGIKDLKSFEEAIFYASRQKKKIAILKSGTNEITRMLTKGHTGSVETFSNEEFNELIEKYSVIRCEDLEEFIYTLSCLSYYADLPRGNKIASINLSGGEAALIGEVAENFKVEFPDFNLEVTKYLVDRLPDYAHITNPLDMTVTLSYDAEKFSDALMSIMLQDNIDMVVIGYTLLRHIDDPCIYYMIEAISRTKEILKEKMKPIFIMSFMSNTRDQESIEKLIKLGVVCLPTPYYGFKVISNLIGR